MGHNGHARKMSNTSSRFWEDCVALAVPLASFRVTNDAIPEGALCHSRETHRPKDVASASGAPSRHVSNGHSLLARGHEMGPGALWRPGGFSREPVGQEPQMQETACRVLISPWGKCVPTSSGTHFPAPVSERALRSAVVSTAQHSCALKAMNCSLPGP